jgi:magnesium transporter
MSELRRHESWDAIRTLILEKKADELNDLLDVLAPGEVARAMTRLNDEEQHGLLILIEPEEAADLVEELPDAQGADIIEDLPAHEAAAILDEMESDHRADVLGEMDDDDAEAILQEMDPKEARDARKLLEYEEDTVGGVMVTEFVAYKHEDLVSDVLQDMRDHAERYSDYGVQYAYVTADSGTLVGVVRLRDLLLAPSTKALKEIMVVNPIYVTAETPLEELNRLFDRYTFWVVPVTDAEGHPVGIARRADAEEALGEEHEKAFLRFTGIIGGEELRSMPVVERSSRRMAWLSVNVVLSFVAASVILLFRETIDAIFALVFFIPIIGNMSGCTGNQAVAVSIRELTLGLIQPKDMMRVWRKELSVGIINGIALGVMMGFIAFVLNYFFFKESPYIALVFGVAFVGNTMVAVSLGGLIPLLLRAFRLDPALGAPPILTTLSDMCSLLFVLSLAAGARLLGLLGVP